MKTSISHKGVFASIIAAAAAALLASCNPYGDPVYTQLTEVGPYTVTPIIDNVWHIEDCNSSKPSGMSVGADGSVSMNNCSDMYVVRGKDKALLIDLSNKISWAPDADKALQEIFYTIAGSKERFITITHNHGDHTGMMYAFPQENYLLPANDFINDSRFPEAGTAVINDGDAIELGGLTLRCVEVPGHTPGSMVFFLEGKDLCFTGDAVGSGSGVWIFSNNAFGQFEGGLQHLCSFIADPANGINRDKLLLYTGHMWQKGNQPVLTMSYLDDMQVLIEKLHDGTAEYEPYSTFQKYLNANFKYGNAVITWNLEDQQKLLQ